MFVSLRWTVSLASADHPLQENPYGYSVDWYSFGLVLYEMLTGVNPFKTGQEMSLVEKMNEILNKEIRANLYKTYINL